MPRPHQVRNSNAAMLLAQFHAMRRRRALSRDRGRRARRRSTPSIAEGLTADVLVLSGGVSVGDYDLVESALIRAGCERLFHNVAMRPGKPILAARRGGCLVLGLPGNPLSAFTCFHVFVAAGAAEADGLSAADGRHRCAPRSSAAPPKPGRLTYHLAHAAARRTGDPPSRRFVAPARATSSRSSTPTRSSSRPAPRTHLPAGAEVDVLPWD